jgi:hypothetical protein
MVDLRMLYWHKRFEASSQRELHREGGLLIMAEVAAFL